MTDMENLGWPIAAVERDTGIGRDTLRVWERRYGFPKPERNAKGERTYPESQVKRLQLVRRLMDRGWRPGRIVGLDEKSLTRLANEPVPGAKEEATRFLPLLQTVHKRDVAALYALLVHTRDEMGLRRLVLEVVAPAARIVGERWAAGELEIFEEHLFTRTVTKFLDTGIGRVDRVEGRPAALLATLPGEPHSLGLMMVEALLYDKGQPTLNLGTEVPLDQLVQASTMLGADTLALSFSSAYPYGQIRKNLVELRARIPGHIRVWIGGGGAQRLKRLPPGVSRKTLEEL